MSGRSGRFWQVLLADLALILFIVSASMLDRPADLPAGDAARTQYEAGPALAIWRDSEDAQPLRDWLIAQQLDDRDRPLITVEHEQGGRDAGLRRVEVLLAEAGEETRDARILVQPGPHPGITVSLQYARVSGETGPDLAWGADEE